MGDDRTAGGQTVVSLVPKLEAKAAGANINEEVVAMLETALKEAQEGHITSIGIAYTTKEGTIGTGWSRGNHLFKLIGAIDHLKFRMHNSAEKDPRDGQ